MGMGKPRSFDIESNICFLRLLELHVWAFDGLLLRTRMVRRLAHERNLHASTGCNIVVSYWLHG